jgi:hypothetical protein
LHPLLSLSRPAVRFWLIVEGQLPIFVRESHKMAPATSSSGYALVELMFASFTEGFETAAIPA